MDTSFLSELNWIAIFCGALGYFMLGAIWYSKIGFSKQWIAYTKIDMSDPSATKGVAMIMISSVVLMFVSSLGIAILNDRLNLIGGWKSGLKLGLLTGLFFGASAISISYLYEKRPMGLHLINGLYTILGNIIAAIIICSWD